MKRPWVASEPMRGRLSKEEQEPRGFWQTLPGVLTAAATIITAVTGLLIASGQLGLFGDDDDGTPTGGQPETVTPQVDDQTDITADPISGTWSGEATQRMGGDFAVRLEIRKGCALNERCGTISVSNVPCFGDLFFHDLSGGRYEFSVENFSAASGKGCTPGAGEYLTPQGDGTLLYTTGYDPAIRGILYKAGD
jgi:hypothetical protein